jgi:porin
MLRPVPTIATAILASVLAAALPTRSARADDKAPTDDAQKFRDLLSSDWNGVRVDLAQRGVEFSLLATNDAIAIVDGGLEQANFFPGVVEPAVGLDLERLIGWKDTLMFVRAFGMYGRDPNEAAGALNSPSNIGNAVQTFRFYEAWIERRFLDDSLNLRAGLYATDSEFDAKGASAVFINSGFGTGVDLSQTGVNGPCIYSTGCLGARLRYSPTPAHYVQVAIVDAVAGDPDDPYGTHIEIGNGEGVLVLGEAGYERSEPESRFLRAALGLWYYSSEFDDLLQVDADGGPTRSRASPGVFAFVEGELLRETPDGAQGLSSFLRGGLADPDVNAVEFFAAGGLTYTGLLPGRDMDVAGFGVLTAINGDESVRAGKLAGTPVDRAEVALEWTYWMPVTAGISLQFDVQYIVDPGADPAIDNVVVLGLRTRIAL